MPKANRVNLDPESDLEYEFLLLLEFDPRVRSFEIQPLLIPYFDQDAHPRFCTEDSSELK